MKIFMLVDDSPVIQKVANRILTDLGFVVVESDDGLDALSKCAHNMPDVMLVDWDLPSMSGVELIEEFKKIPDSDNTKILYCTSEILVSEMTKAKRAGAHGFLMKPFNRAILSNKLVELGLMQDQKAA